jgi:hypothetical protein
MHVSLLAFTTSSATCVVPTGQSDSFVYRLTDCNGNTAEAPVTLNFQPQPTAKDDVYEYNGQPFTKLASTGVLANDVSEGSSEPLTARLRAQAMNGFVSMSRDGAYTYSPADMQVSSGGNNTVQAASASTAESTSTVLAGDDTTIMAGERKRVAAASCLCCHVAILLQAMHVSHTLQT